MEPKYTIDTCSLTAMRRVYPEDVFPGAWRKLSELADSGAVIAVDEVLEELKAEDDEVLEWAQAHSGIFVPLTAEIQTEATKILVSHSTLVDLRKRKSGADPFVIASAVVHRCAVVTEEKPSGGPGKVKIPDVCKAMKIKCINILTMLRREGMRLE